MTGFNAETMEVKLTATGGFSTTLTVDESGKTSLSARGGDGGLPDETMTLSVEEKSSGGGGNTGLTDPVTISVNVITGNDYLDTFGNNLKVDGVDVVNGRVTVEKAATHVISVLPAYGMAIQKTEINGTEVAGRESEGWVSYTVDEVESKSYTIFILEAKRHIYTVVWFYDEATVEDAKVLNGTVKIISAKLPDSTDSTSGFVGENSHDETGGHYSIIPGSTVTVELKPDYGYQFVAGSLNGQPVTAGTEVSTFTFTMPEANLHLSALFTKTEDIINADSTQVTSGSLANGANVVDSGNLKLNIGDLTETEINSIKDEMEETAGDDEIQLYLDMDLYNVVNKGASKAAWENKLTNLDGDLSVTLTLSEELKGKDGTFYVIREHEEENGSKSYTKIQASYDQEAGTITFATNKFSTYALVLEPPVHDPIPELVIYHNIQDESGTADVAAHLRKYDSSLAVKSYSSEAVTTGNIQASQVTSDGKVSYTLTGSSGVGDNVTIPVTIGSDSYKDFVLNVKIVAKEMEEKDVTLTDDGATTGNISAKVNIDKTAPITTLANLTVTKIKDILQITDSTSATLYLEVQNADATVPVADKTKVTGKVTSDIPGGIVGRYLDLTLYKQVGGSAVEQMTDTGTQSLQVKVQLPDELKNTDSTKNRTYYIARVHEGHATVLPVTFDGTNLIFSTNQFSTYAIIYKDTPKTTGGTSGSSTSSSSYSSSVKSNPVQKVAAPTGDSTPVGMYVILLLASAAVLVYLGRKKFKESK